jgi:glycosyltransferase involved in cell wall biosynthesis
MHILLIHQSFASPYEPGGTRHYELAHHLVQDGHRFTIVASNLNYWTGQRVAKLKGVISEEHIDGVHVLRAYTYPSLHRSFIWRTVSFISFMITSVFAAMRAGPVDLVIGTSPPIFQGISAWLIALLRQCPFVLEVRDLWPEFAIDIGVLRNPILIALSRWLERVLYTRAVHIIVNSPAYRSYLLEKGVVETKISLIPNGVDPDVFNVCVDKKLILNNFSIYDKFVVTYTGIFGLANDIETILRASKNLLHEKKIHFLLVGDGKERINLETKAKEMKLTNVTFTGLQPKAYIPEILAVSDVCIATLKDIPMFRTTYPNKVFDYMAAGRPTILAIDGVIREVVEDARGGVFVPPGNAEALAEAIRELSQNRQKAQAMGAAARTYVAKYFNRRQQATQFAALIQQLVEQGSPTTSLVGSRTRWLRIIF